MLQRSVIAEITLGLGMNVAPLLGSLPEEGDIKQVGLVSIDEGGLIFVDGGWDKRLFDSVGMDAVVDLCKGALEIPSEMEAFIFLLFETLKFFDEVEFELDGDPKANSKAMSLWA